MAEIKPFTKRNAPVSPRAIVLFERDGTKRLFAHGKEIARILAYGELQKVSRIPYGDRTGTFLRHFIEEFAPKGTVSFMPTGPDHLVKLWDRLPDDCFLDREIVQNALY